MICSHITFPMVYSFYFLCFDSGRNECNSLWEELRGRGQKSTAYSEGYLIRREKMIYCDNIMINLSCKVIACGIILSSVKLEKKVHHSENDIRISHNLLSPSPSLSKDYCIHSFWSQNTEKRNNTISQMRLRSVFKMRMSILNTATTEQMGYGSISFFVCSLMNQIVNHNYKFRFSVCYYTITNKNEPKGEKSWQEKRTME